VGIAFKFYYGLQSHPERACIKSLNRDECFIKMYILGNHNEFSCERCTAIC
jgi:hypothetical protein